MNTSEEKARRECQNGNCRALAEFADRGVQGICPAPSGFGPVVSSDTVPPCRSIAIPGVTMCLSGPGGLLKLRPKTLTGVLGVFVCVPSTAQDAA